MRLSRKLNVDEDAEEKMYTHATHVVIPERQGFRGLGVVTVQEDADDE